MHEAQIHLGAGLGKSISVHPWPRTQTMRTSFHARIQVDRTQVKPASHPAAIIGFGSGEYWSFVLTVPERNR